MASFAALKDVGDSVAALLTQLYRIAQPASGLPAGLAFSHITLGELAAPNAVLPTGVSLTCYRVLQSSHQRPQATGRSSRPERLGLELHYLLTAWSRESDAVRLHEQTALAWAMLQLHRHAVLDRAILLGGDAVWERDEVVHFVHEPVSHDAMFRLWDALQPKYRLSATYCARVVRIADLSDTESYPPVLTQEFGFADAPRELVT
jgi:Pvc16 N-terminal domain